MIPKEIDGVPITKPCTPHDRGYIKGWEARQGEIDVLEDEIFQYNEELSDARTEIEGLKGLLRRHKKSMEPFPVVSDLRSMTQKLREKHDETEIKAINASYKKYKEKFRRLYRDTVKAITGKE